MKGDFTRLTFDRSRHFKAVQLVQGIVHLDAYWNEQQHITTRRVEVEAEDVIGRTGAPLVGGGFRVVAKVPDDLTPAEIDDGRNVPANAPAGEPILTAGRFYVDGILCENDAAVPLSAVRDPASAIPANNRYANGTYIIYARAFTRVVTPLEAPALKDPALGEASAALRLKTEWRIGALAAHDNATCSLDPSGAWDKLIAPASGRLEATVATATVDPDPCVLPLGGGYKGLENRLYRVEITTAGKPGTAKLQWSPWNAAFEAAWSASNNKRVEIGPVPRGPGHQFQRGAIVELTDADREAARIKGEFRRVTDVDGNALVFKDNAPAHPGADKGARVRLWRPQAAGEGPEEAAEIAIPANGGPVDLGQDGIKVAFEPNADYALGAHWLISARARTGDIDPKDRFVAPFGFVDHFARLAVGKVANGQWTLTDCRPRFAPLTRLLSFEYRGGDGQIARPDPAQPQANVALPVPLAVGVAFGIEPVADASVVFTIEGAGNQPGPGRLDGQAGTATVATNAAGIAQVSWGFSVQDAARSRTVRAQLLASDKTPIGQPIRFVASLLDAGSVPYSPACSFLKSLHVTNVQGALEALCERKAEAPPRLVVKQVRVAGQILSSDLDIKARDFQGGIEIEMDDALSDASFAIVTSTPGTSIVTTSFTPVGPVMVTLELPWPLPRSPDQFYRLPPLSVSWLVQLDGLAIVDRRRPNVIMWTPEAHTIRIPWLGDNIASFWAEIPEPKRLRAVLRVKGGAISARDLKRQLDGSVRSVTDDKGRTKYDFPSGDLGARWSDLEVWFWLVPTS